MMLTVLQVLLNRLSAHLLPAAGRLAARLIDLLRITAFDAYEILECSNSVHYILRCVPCLKQ
jgi:hypothetical protein